MWNRKIFGLKHQEVALLFLLILSGIVYLNSIFGDFLLDDEILIQKNAAIHSLWNIGLLTYRWLRTFSYAVDYSIWGLNPIGYHLSNIFYNSLTVLVVYLLTRSLTKNLTISFVTSLLFALHPIHTEAVSYLSGRRDILSALFYLLGFFAYLKGRERGGRGYYAGAIVSYLLSISAKEMGVTLPLLIFAYEVIMGIHEQKETVSGTAVLFFRSLGRSLKRFRWVILLSAILLGGYLYVDLFLEHASGMVTSKGIQWWGGNPVSNFATVSTVVAAYVKKLFFPVVLRADYRMIHYFHSFLAFPVVLSAGLILTLILVSFLYLRRYWMITFAIWFFFITLLPVMQIIPHHILMAEHFLYLPSYGFCLLCGQLVEWGIRRRRVRPPVLLILCLVGGLWFVRVVNRNFDWADTVSITRSGLRYDPENPIYHFFLGRAYFVAHLGQSAQKELDQALSTRYKYSMVHSVRAAVAFSYGNYEKGEKETASALKYDSADPMALINQAYFDLFLGRYREAKEYYLRVRPENLEGVVLTNLARIALHDGDRKEARRWMERALNRWPKRSDLHYEMAEVLVKGLKFRQAAKEYREALRLGGDHHDSSGFLKGVPEKIEWAKRLQHQLDALKKTGQTAGAPEVGRAYGRLYRDAGNYREAERRLRSAWAKGDSSRENRRLLAEVLLKEGKRATAVKIVQGILEEEGRLSDECLQTAVDVLSQGLNLEEAIRLEKKLVSRHPGEQSFTERLSALEQMLDLQNESHRLDEEGNPVGAAITKGDLLVRLGRVQEAITVCESALEKKPDDLELLRKLCDLYEAGGYRYRQKAIRTGRRILKLNPRDSQTALRLWRLYYNQVEDYESALAFLEKAIQADPTLAENPKIARELNALRRYVRTFHAAG